LQLDRVYTSRAHCDSALALRASQRALNGYQASDPPKFPPILELPTANEAIGWIQANKFIGTQPFAQFVSAFELSGDQNRARDLRIGASNELLNKSIRELCPVCFRWGAARAESTESEPDPYKSDGNVSPLMEVVRWFERAVVTFLGLMLKFLAGHAYRPERIGWFVVGTIVLALLIFRHWIKVIAYTVESDTKLRPIGFWFLFDRLLPAYRIREGNYNIDKFYAISDTVAGSRRSVRHLGVRRPVIEASAQQSRRAERMLDVLRLCGLVFTIFVIAAISRLPH
jgi:hypothetical protein